MNLPTPGTNYDPRAEAVKNRVLEQADAMNLKRQADIDVVSGSRLILTSPNGTRYSITVSNAGALAATAV